MLKICNEDVLNYPSEESDDSTGDFFKKLANNHDDELERL